MKRNRQDRVPAATLRRCSSGAALLVCLLSTGCRRAYSLIVANMNGTPICIYSDDLKMGCVPPKSLVELDDFVEGTTIWLESPTGVGLWRFSPTDEQYETARANKSQFLGVWDGKAFHLTGSPSAGTVAAPQGS